ncbi:efflux RND transporter periplasmic adaptor subunit [Luteimonas abyssi]|uniref:efflux RND transporter periplasmic adaptor subunit n=1 Tax=Luteimonas abyssi TaxID=1247514 RepID=UPI000737C565|nr:efflux RND transporter periplasmic adaptor subunit [Luteimonas abyssi]
MNSKADLLKELRIDRKPEPPPSRRGLWIGLGIAAAVVLLAALVWLWLGASRPIPVRTAPVAASGGAGAAPASVLDASGYVVARRIATVSAKITGRVREVMIEEGMAVEDNQILATLDPIDADAERELAASRVSAARSQVSGVQARLEQAQSEARRLETLVGQQLVSRSQYDQAVAQRDALRSELETARRNAQVAGDQLSLADIGVDNTVVRAPFAGVITAKAAQPGEIVSPLSAGGGFTRTGIGTIVDMDSLEIEVDVGEAYIGRVQPRMPVQATLNAYPDWKIPAEVIAIVPTADRGKATVKVRIALKVKDPRIVPDMGVSVSFLEQATEAEAAEDAPRILRVPAAALVQRDGRTVAFAVAGDRVEQRVVQAAGSGDPREVRSGLAAGEDVVLDPPDALSDGSAIVRE